MKDTKIRWATHSWNPMTGCSEISPGCTRCYARVISERFGAPAFPNGFDPTFKPKKLPLPTTIKKPSIIFVNSMSDLHHQFFTRPQIDAVYDVMLAERRHQYLVLTKRPQRMADYFHGPEGYLARRALDEVPAHVWLGTSIENDRYTFRANWLRTIDVPVRFVSAEPLLGPVDSLNLDGISWVIVGGESGAGFRPMDLDWARALRDRCLASGVAFYFKQSAGIRTEMGIELDGERWEQYPVEVPA